MEWRRLDFRDAPEPRSRVMAQEGTATAGKNGSQTPSVVGDVSMPDRENTPMEAM